MAHRTERFKTDGGYVLTRYAIVGDVEVRRRDDLRGCWEVNGQVYGDRAEALTAAEAYLDTLQG